MHRYCHNLSRLCLLLFALWQITSYSHAQQAFEYYGEKQPLKDVITAIATHAKQGVVIDESIDQEFNGLIKRKNVTEALNFLAATYDLIWYSDNATLFVYPINQKMSKIFRLANTDANQVKKTMSSLDLWDKRFDFRQVNGGSMILVSGPPRYLELIEESIAMLEQRNSSLRADQLDIRVFQLRHASAEDRRVTVRKQETTLPGIATIIKALLSNRSNGSSTEGSNESPINYNIVDIPTNSENTSEEQLSKTDSAKNVIKSNAMFNAAINRSSQFSLPHPQAAVFAEPSTNTVIVQDFRSRMPLYETLIQNLDVPRKQLEISLLIIDLSTNSLSELGVDWTISRQNVESGTGLLELILPGANAASSELIEQTNIDFLARVTALESQGKARVTSRPAVVTENGVEAILDNSETFFVRIQGERVAELEEITYGTLLQVTPRVIEQNSPSSIYLDVNIEDANRLIDGGIESLPTIRKTQINTRTAVPDGASLLIGGYYRDARSANNDSVPILNKLPLVGSFFEHKGENSSQLVRLFMLSPRILTRHAYESKAANENILDLSLEQQIFNVSDLSNFNPDLQALKPSTPCELAYKARERRNWFIEKGYAAAISRCKTINDDIGYRVLTKRCTSTSYEGRCQ
ncbi:type III secretion system outer membrane ring subunit SctC [Pleionea sediminis]|uniref:type III secretion system outer membrane ring subunit SctC n=1 Tax=Pleionea sediminis TaxID=2569479 RepID=UPI001186BB14|nr:type III secretion system outer membrane ring subunit SctC [Pleionea sediminis]